MKLTGPNGIFPIMQDARHIVALMKDHIAKLLWEKVVDQAIH